MGRQLQAIRNKTLSNIKFKSNGTDFIIFCIAQFFLTKQLKVMFRLDNCHVATVAVLDTIVTSCPVIKVGGKGKDQIEGSSKMKVKEG